MSDWLVPGLILFIVGREVYFSYMMDKMVNKLMSRTYYDYQISKEVTKLNPHQPIKVEESDSMNEEAQQLNGLMSSYLTGT